MPFTVTTFNIYNHEDFDQRLPLILRTLAAVEADLICLQEVPPEDGRSRALASSLGYAHVAEVVFVRPDDGWSEGLVVLSKHPITETEPVDLRPDVPNCLRARMDVESATVDVYNTHLHPRDSSIRQAEAAVIMARIAGETVPAIVCGDFNAVPAGATMAVVWPHLRSAFEIANGAHPETTFPTALRPLSGRQPGFSERRESPPADDEGQARAAIDYVLVREGQFRVLDARVIGDAIDGRWPSDHFGVVARLESTAAEWRPQLKRRPWAGETRA